MMRTTRSYLPQADTEISFEFIFMSGIQARWSGATFPEYHDGRQVQGNVKKFFNFSQQGEKSIKLVLADDPIFYITGNAYDLCNKDRVYERIQPGSEVSLYVSDEGDRAFIMALSCDGIEYLNFETTKSEWQEDYINQVLMDFPAIQFCNIALVILLVIIVIQTDMGMKKNGYYPNRRISRIS